MIKSHQRSFPALFLTTAAAMLLCRAHGIAGAAPDDNGAHVFPSGRAVYYDIEPIPMRLPAATDRITINFSTQDGRSRAVEAPAYEGLAELTLNPLSLSPGLWQVSAGAWTGALEVVSSARNSSFTFMVRGDSAAPRRALAQETLKSLAVNLVQVRASDWAPPSPETVDMLARVGARFSTMGTVARKHYVLDESRSWADPEVIMSARYTVCHQAQAWRHLGPGLLGVHLARFPRLTEGVVTQDGAARAMAPGAEPRDAVYIGPLVVPAQQKAWLDRTGVAAPDLLKPDTDFNAWMNYQRWRTSLLGEALGILKLEVGRTAPDLIAYAGFDGWQAVNHALYPPAASARMDVVVVSEDPSRSRLGLLGAAAAADMYRAGAWDKPILIEPFGDHGGWTAVPESAFSLSIYASLARKVEGVCWPHEGSLKRAAERAAARIMPISGMLYEAGKLRDKVGLLYSRDQHLYEISREPRKRLPGLDYPGRLAAAWLTAAACGYPVTFVTEEDIISGLDYGCEALIVTGLTCTREPVRDALERFSADGRAILTDMATGQDIAGAKQLPFAFPPVFSEWQPYKPENADRQGDREFFERFIRPNIESLAKELDSLIQSFAKCDNPTFLLAEQDAGFGRYIWVVNTAQEKAEHCQWRPVAASGRLTLPQAVPVVYDVFGHKEIAEREYELHLEAGEAALLGMFPEAVHLVGIDNIQFRAPLLHIEISVNSRNRLIKAVFPVEIELIDPNGKTVLTLWRGTRNGKVMETVPMGNAPVEGAWRIVAREIITGRSTLAQFEVRGSGENFATAERVKIYEENRTKRSLLTKGEILLLAGDQLGKLAAAPLQAILKQKGSDAVIGRAADHTSAAAFDAALPYFGGKLPLAIGKTVVLLGNRKTNPLIGKLTEDYGIGPPALSHRSGGGTGGYGTGPGRAVVFPARGAFGIDHEIVVIYADDARGIELGVKAVAGMLDGRGGPERQLLDAR